MTSCPQCLDEYEDGVSHCAVCGLSLAEPAPPPPLDARLGLFHPAIADLVAALLERRGIAYQRFADAEQVEIVVAHAWRDDVRAELTLNWADLIRRLPEEDRRSVLAGGGAQPGWRDAPQGAWIDRQGRIQVDASPQDTAAEDARRTVGPVLAWVGAGLLLGAWYFEAGVALALVGLGAVVVGLFLPQ